MSPSRCRLATCPAWLQRKLAQRNPNATSEFVLCLSLSTLSRFITQLNLIRFVCVCKCEHESEISSRFTQRWVRAAAAARVPINSMEDDEGWMKSKFQRSMKRTTKAINTWQHSSIWKQWNVCIRTGSWTWCDDILSLDPSADVAWIRNRIEIWNSSSPRADNKATRIMTASSRVHVERQTNLTREWAPKSSGEHTSPGGQGSPPHKRPIVRQSRMNPTHGKSISLMAKTSVAPKQLAWGQQRTHSSWVWGIDNERGKSISFVRPIVLENET